MEELPEDLQHEQLDEDRDPIESHTPRAGTTAVKQTAFLSSFLIRLSISGEWTAEFDSDTTEGTDNSFAEFANDDADAFAASRAALGQTIPPLTAFNASFADFDPPPAAATVTSTFEAFADFDANASTPAASPVSALAALLPAEAFPDVADFNTVEVAVTASPEAPLIEGFADFDAPTTTARPSPGEAPLIDDFADFDAPAALAPPAAAALGDVSESGDLQERCESCCSTLADCSPCPTRWYPFPYTCIPAPYPHPSARCHGMSIFGRQRV